MRDGKPEPYHIVNAGNGVQVYMGQRGHLLTSGDYTYTLTYTTTRQVGFFDDHDALYWNVTGNGWRLPIDSSEAVLELPPGANVTTHAVFTGRYGERGENSPSTPTWAVASGFELPSPWPRERA